MTGGEVSNVNPTDLTKNFANMLSLPTIATNVAVKVKLHKGLEFRNEDQSALSQDKSLMARELGNVNEDTEITFEYRLKPVKELIKMTDIDLTQISAFPFQAQISYTSLDGNKCIRVITSKQDISNDRSEVEKEADLEILGMNAIQQSSKMARQGKVLEAQVYAKAQNRRQKTYVNNEAQQQ